jgi:hypothetical protein
MACLISKKGSSLHDKSATHVPAHVLPMSPVHTGGRAPAITPAGAAVRVCASVRRSSQAGESADRQPLRGRAARRVDSLQTSQAYPPQRGVGKPARRA